MNSVACPNAEQFLNFSQSDQTWTVGDQSADADLPDKAHSIPWRVDATCNATVNNPKCYEIEFENRKHVTVCVHPGINSKLSDFGTEYLAQEFPLEWARPIDVNDAQHFGSRQKCHRQTMSELNNTIIESWVSRDDEIMCDNVVADAGDAPGLEKVFQSSGSQRYECVLDTGHIARQNARIEPEMRWVRKTSYPCKDDGWSCTEEDMHEYTGGQMCTLNDDCHKNVEFGVCNLQKNVCMNGSASGKNCTTHEDCDTIQEYASGKCDSGKCSRGSTGVEVSYFKPQECPAGGNVNRNGQKYVAKHQYCGAISDVDGETKYTGYCTPVHDVHGNKISSFRACKPFVTLDEKKAVEGDEADFQSGHPATSKLNYYEEPPPWERLTLCPPDKVRKVGNEIICTATMEEVPTKLDTNILATSSEDANQQCRLAYPMYMSTGKLKF